MFLHQIQHTLRYIDKKFLLLRQILSGIPAIKQKLFLETVPLASCLIYARPLRPDRWLVSACFVDSWRSFRVLIWVRSFIEPDFLKTMYRSTIYYSNLSDQSALETGLGLGLDSELHYFSIFHGE